MWLEIALAIAVVACRGPATSALRSHAPTRLWLGG